MEKHRRKISVWIGAALILLWLICMLVLTVAVRNLHAAELTEFMYGLTANMDESFLEDYYGGDRVSGLPGEADYLMLSQMNAFAKLTPWLGTISYPHRLGETASTVDTAVLFMDAEGKILHASDDYALYFQYFTEESWEQGKNSVDGWGWISLNPKSQDSNNTVAQKLLWQMILEEAYGQTGSVDLLRLDGKWSGSEFIPERNFSYVLDAGHGDWQKKDAEGELQWAWQTSFSEGRSIYLIRPQMAKSETELTDGLRNLVTENVKPQGPKTVAQMCNAIHILDKESFGRIIIYDAVAFPEAQNQIVSENAALYMITVSEAHPLQSALKALTWIYVASFALAVLEVVTLSYLISKRILKPMEEEMGEDQSEIVRLNKALDYAHRAEENRRALVSGVAHELKTPLAVIHGYAEGLKERIAEDKREKYLDTILSETERMDGLVLQMLDLSRLEAGKVKLARDEFDLSEMVREVFEKLELLAGQKNLGLSFEMPERMTVTADRGRMEQVITNFASNAVRYTQPGGWIAVRVFGGERGWGMTVENKCRPFSPEQLDRIFDSFYRADESRTGKGTGLGLAIARSIVELHGGKCHVRNTGPGVEFGFRIPGK